MEGGGTDQYYRKSDAQDLWNTSFWGHMMKTHSGEVRESYTTASHSNHHDGTKKACGSGVHVRTFGGLEVSIDASPMKVSRKRPRMELNLLIALVARGPRGDSRRSLGLTLWPDAEEANATNACAITINRLRHRLGDSRALVALDGRVALRSDRVTIDAWEFCDACAILERACHTQDTLGELAASRVFELYKGEFAPDYDLPCALGARERYRLRFRRAVTQWGRLLKHQGRLVEAICHFENATEVCSLEESFYLDLMDCYAANGAVVAAMRTFENACALFRGAYGVEPSSILLAKYRGIRDRSDLGVAPRCGERLTPEELQSGGHGVSR